MDPAKKNPKDDNDIPVPLAPHRKFTHHDVLFGRGSATRDHPGNVQFRKKVDAYYLQAFQKHVRAKKKPNYKALKKAANQLKKKLEEQGTRFWREDGTKADHSEAITKIVERWANLRVKLKETTTPSAAATCSTKDRLGDNKATAAASSSNMSGSAFKRFQKNGTTAAAAATPEPPTKKPKQVQPSKSFSFVAIHPSQDSTTTTTTTKAGIDSFGRALVTPSPNNSTSPPKDYSLVKNPPPRFSLGMEEEKEPSTMDVLVTEVNANLSKKKKEPTSTPASPAAAQPSPTDGGMEEDDNDDELASLGLTMSPLWDNEGSLFQSLADTPGYHFNLDS